MKILSHRGYWQTEIEKNTLTAFVRSFQLGFGTETDIRDRNGQLVISHDPPTDKSFPVEEFLEIYKQHGEGLPLALNIKADGLQNTLKQILLDHKVSNYFVFDMSIPDTLSYLRNDMNFLIRESEYEKDLPFYPLATGIWLDCFEGEWMTKVDITKHLDAGKLVCLVSPDLHKREYKSFWANLADWGLHKNDSLMICTDYPEVARLFFNG